MPDFYKMDLVSNLPQVVKVNSLLKETLDNSQIRVDLVNNLLLAGLTKVIHVKVDKIKAVHLVMAKVKEIDPEVTQAKEECKMVQIKEVHRVAGAKAKEVPALIKVADKMEVVPKTNKVIIRTRVQLKIPKVANRRTKIKTLKVVVPSLRHQKEFFSKQLL